MAITNIVLTMMGYGVNHPAALYVQTTAGWDATDPSDKEQFIKNFRPHSLVDLTVEVKGSIYRWTAPHPAKMRRVTFLDWVMQRRADFHEYEDC